MTFLEYDLYVFVYIIVICVLILFKGEILQILLTEKKYAIIGAEKRIYI